MSSPSRIPLILAPTPLHRLDRASEALGVDLWIKRDDLTGMALGGNKGRKLEYLLGEAIAMNADTVITCGAAQSNFIRQLGAACAMLGLKCAAVTMDLPYEDHPPEGIRLDPSIGNPFLDGLFGVELTKIPDGPWETLYDATDRLADQLTAVGRQVYRIPIGGSSHLGAYAFYQAAQEVKIQYPGFDWIVTCSSSGSTQTGLTYGFRDDRTKVLGISADPEPEMIDDLVSLGNRLAEFLQVSHLPKSDFLLNLDYFGTGYGVTDRNTLSAISWLAKMEGILLDPIYTGKAFRGLKDLVQKGELMGQILFWHTGGLPTLFGIVEDLPNL